MRHAIVLHCSIVGVCRWLALAGGVVGLSAGTWAQSVDDDTDSAFSEAYAAYTSAVEAGDRASALTAAKRAYELGSAHFGHIDTNTGALAMNYGNMLALTGTDNVPAAAMFREADAIYEELYGANSPQRLEALLALASVQETFEEKLATINAALRMHRAVLPDDDISYARLQSQSGADLVSLRNASPEAEKMLTQALDTLAKEFGEDSPELLPTLVALANVTM